MSNSSSDASREKVPRVAVFIFSSLYLAHVAWYCVINVNVNSFYGTLVPWLVDIYPNDTHKGDTVSRTLMQLRILTRTFCVD